jgi:predicted acylesterase/phospholipase RssA
MLSSAAQAHGANGHSWPAVDRFEERGMSTLEARAQNKTHRDRPRPPFEQIALVLQGGGALGAYQAGVYEALAEADLHPDWVAGISIGAINTAIIAGNPPQKASRRISGTGSSNIQTSCLRLEMRCAAT